MVLGHRWSNFMKGSVNPYSMHSLFALHTIALHPDSHPAILLLFMHSKLAQITRTWIVATITLGTLIDIPQPFLLQCQQTYPQLISYTATSYPHDIITWLHKNTISPHNIIHDNTESQTNTRPAPCSPHGPL